MDFICVVLGLVDRQDGRGIRLRPILGMVFRYVVRVHSNRHIHPPRTQEIDSL